jgi:dihydroorotase-like cyclic amidohydrolase
LAEDLDVPVHVAHVSSTRALQVIRRFQRDGVDVSAETCPHYLFFTEDDYLRLGPYAKYNPPIRTTDDQRSLWQGLADGIISVVTSDHATYLVEEKERHRDQPWLIPSGGPGVQTLLPMMLTAALQGRLSVEQVVRLISAEPARLFGLEGRKGAIEPGLDADLCVYDPRPQTVMTRDKMLSKARDVEKLYDGMPLQGEVTATVSGGQSYTERARSWPRKGAGASSALTDGTSDPMAVRRDVDFRCYLASRTVPRGLASWPPHRTRRTKWSRTALAMAPPLRRCL